jgi:hypothetical protein
LVLSYPVCSGVKRGCFGVIVCCFGLQFSSIVGAVTPSGLLLLWPLLVLSLVHIVMGVVPGGAGVLFRYTHCQQLPHTDASSSIRMRCKNISDRLSSVSG